MTDKTTRDELKILREEKASVNWVMAKCTPIEKDIDELKKGVEGAKTHHCLKDDTLRRLETIVADIPAIKDDLSSWKFFRNVLMGAFGTFLILLISGIVVFANVKADTETNTKKISKIEKQKDIEKLTQIQTSLEIIQRTLEEN